MESPDADLDITLIAEARAWAKSGYARALRKGLNLTLTEIAAKTGVSPGAVSLWERNKRRPRTPEALTYGRILVELAATAAALATDATRTLGLSRAQESKGAGMVEALAGPLVRRPVLVAACAPGEARPARALTLPSRRRRLARAANGAACAPGRPRAAPAPPEYLGWPASPTCPRAAGRSLVYHAGHAPRKTRYGRSPGTRVVPGSSVCVAHRDRVAFTPLAR